MSDTLASGHRLGPYEIVAPIGAGGMGRVYRARDTRLGRTLAIKVLGDSGDGDAIARLRREAEAASSLNHPAILTIYDIGETAEAGVFIAMELIEGCNLREWLRRNPSRESRVDVVRQVAAGLAAAHAHGIVHRDIKPENIMVTRSGFAKLVDFGLAKPIEPAGAEGNTDVKITAAGRVVGTFAYMSPEQLAGEPVDWRSDIYAFGCVLRDVFPNDSQLRAIIDRCTQRDRSLRFQSVDAITEAMRAPARQWRWLAVAAAALIAMAIVLTWRRPAPVPAVHPAGSGVAVLPFRALGTDAYVADGISDALTTDLARQPGLTVIARNSASHYTADTDFRKAAGDLGVRYLLVGSVQPAANHLRIDARLIDATDNAHVWADHFERPLGEVFAAESAIVHAVASKLAPTRGGRNVTQPSDPRVAELFLRARFFTDDPRWQVQAQAIPLLEQVVQLDPTFMPAHIQLAQQYQQEAFSLDPDRRWEQKAFVELQKILAADPTAAAAYTIRANLHWTRNYGFAHEEALADLRQAVHVDPNFVDAWNSRGSLLSHLGLFEEALSDFGHVLRLDPYNKYARYRIARIHLFQQKCAEAVSEFESGFPDDFQLPVALQCAGRSQEALDALGHVKVNQTAATVTAESDAASASAVVYAALGRRAEALSAIRTAIAKERPSSHFHHATYFIAAAYAQLHDAPHALHWLERTSREGMPCYPLFASDPLLDPIRSDPRIAAFLDASRREWEELRRHYRS